VVARGLACADRRRPGIDHRGDLPRGPADARPGPLRAHRLALRHYPNNARIVREARARGFHNALSLDQEGHVAETASTNVFLVRDGEVLTPATNGTFLNGITRQRVIGLLRADGYTVSETALTVGDFTNADEIFVTGNAYKVVPVTRFEDRELGPSPVAARAGALYHDFAHQDRRAA
jgi:branched-chain amino acid aminotransferase